MIIQMSSERAAYSANRTKARDAKWSRSLRLAVALASAAGSWIIVVGVGYLISQFF